MPVAMRLMVQQVGHPLGEVFPSVQKNVGDCFSAFLVGPANQSVEIDVTVFHDGRSLCYEGPLWEHGATITATLRRSKRSILSR